MSDTETLLALVSSQLSDSELASDINAILDALVQCDGDAAAAAQLLNSKIPSRTGTKRKKPHSLDEWLQQKPLKCKGKTGSGSNGASETRQIEPSSRPGPSKAPATVDLMSVLRQAPSSKKNIPKLPPLLLASPALVADHTPCTLHPSVLPVELAARLFHTMIQEAQSWQRNKWWLFDRVVESPHRTSFYARKNDGGHGSWQEAARFW